MSLPRADYLFTSAIEAPDLDVPEGKRVSFGLDAIPVLPDGILTRLYWSAASSDVESRLRLMIALDVREEVLIEVIALQTEKVIGTLDIRYAYVCQPFEMLLNPEQTASALLDGVGLRMVQGTKALWFFNAVVPETTLFRPHLLTRAGGAPLQHFYQRLTSLDSIQPFSWMEGCVLDGLLDLSHSNATSANAQLSLKAHLEQFIDSKKRLFYEDPQSRPVDDRIYGIEGTLPFAAIAETWPNHRLIEQVVSFWRMRITENGAIVDGGTLSAEGSYTIAYPLALIAQQKNDPELLDLALRQLILRRDYLVHENGLYLRYHQDGTRSFRNWARGCAWYMLGLARTLIWLGKDSVTAELRAEFERVAAWIKAYARSDGLWSCFVDEHEVAVDTSGSAGIAAALALGAKNGLLDESYRVLAAQTFESLQTYLTPDGLLTGVAQSNRGGEALQRSDYRVISQMGMGLMGQLAAALE